MGTHQRAWQGINLVVLGKTQMVSMQLEQAIASASPANEIRVDSFEEYNAAFDFCKQSQSVGFLILLDNISPTPLHDVFRELAQPYEKRGWPCFGIILHEGQETFTGHRALQLCPQLIGYLPTSAFLDRIQVYATLSKIWSQYIDAFQQHVLPAVLEDSIYALIEPIFSQGERLFVERTTVAMTANLNLSWIDMFALRWAPLFDALKTVNQPFWETLSVARQICETALPDPDVKSFEDVEQAKGPLAARVAAVLRLLHQSLRNGTLESAFVIVRRLNKPGASALIRHLSKIEGQLRGFATPGSASPVQNEQK